MRKSRFQPNRTVPNITTTKSSPVTVNFAKGINTYAPNDTIDASELSLAQDARFDRMGEYKTRKGLSQLSKPIGEAIIYDNLSELGEDDTYGMSLISELENTVDCEIKHTGTVSNVFYGIRLRISADDNEYGVMQVNLKPSKNSQQILATTCVDPALVGTTAKDIDLVFMQAPETNTSSVWVEIKQQRGGKRAYRVGSLQGKLLCKMSSATKGKITSIFEANLSDTTGTETDESIVFTFAKDGDTSGKETMYRMNKAGEITELTQIKTDGRPVRYSQEASTVRCAFGGSPMTLNPTDLTGSIGWEAKEIKTIDLATGTDLEIKVSNIINGTQDNLLYFDKETNTQAIWTYPYGFNHKDNVINSFDKFDRDFRQNFPSINTGDPLTAIFNMGGMLYIQTRRHKYQLLMDTVESWNQAACAANGGTFSQESVVVGTDYTYFANNDGIFQFDGYTEVSLTKNKIQNIYDSIENKEQIKLEIHGNRLYVLCPDSNMEHPGKCLVYNLKLSLWESFDTNMYISAMFARKSPSRRFICGHSRMGLLMLAETVENKHDDMGAPLQFELRTAYLHYGTPSQYKRIMKWRPEFSTTNEGYSVSCGYALDLNDDVKYAFSINLKNRFIWRGQDVWDYPNGATVHESMENKLATTTKIHGRFRRCQLRYQHYAAFEPVTLKSHTVTIQTQRIR